MIYLLTHIQGRTTIYISFSLKICTTSWYHDQFRQVFVMATCHRSIQENLCNGDRPGCRPLKDEPIKERAHHSLLFPLLSPFFIHYGCKRCYYDYYYLHFPNATSNVEIAIAHWIGIQVQCRNGLLWLLQRCQARLGQARRYEKRKRQPIAAMATRY